MVDDGAGAFQKGSPLSPGTVIQRELTQSEQNLFISVEPVASARPKFPSLADSQTFKVLLGGAMTLLCPAQGFPVPTHR